MTSDANVVTLKKQQPEPSQDAPQTRLPNALIEVREQAVLHVRQALQELFDNADDSLFAIADRASSDTEQQAFFEAMRDLRLKRKNIERALLQSMHDSFAGLNQLTPAKLPEIDSVNYDSLSLVQNDELEQSVAIDVMVAKVTNRGGPALSHLTTRINAMVSKKIDNRTNPMGPYALCEGFVAASAILGVEIRVKLIILKLFERYVLADIDQLYAEANRQLIAAGVLPELKSVQPQRKPVRASSASSAAALSGDGEQAEGVSGGFAGENVQEVFSVLQGLLSQVRAVQPVARAAQTDAQPISSNDLLRLLSYMQQRQPDSTEQSVDLRGQLDTLLSRASQKSGKNRVVGEVDEDVINLVSMLFEFILDDRTLPGSLKALIARLQIPMLKVAVLDKTFFSRGSHPARRLLNEIASAALGWVEHDNARRDSLYKKIEQVVQRLLNEFVDDPQIFAELLEDFIAFSDHERRRSERLEQRMRDAEEGAARVEVARGQVEEVLNQRLLGKTLPQVVVRLLQEAWSKQLQLICLRSGTESAEWQGALALMDDLIWSVQPHTEPGTQARLIKMIPTLVKAIREGLADSGVDPFSSGELLIQLEALHIQSIRRAEKTVERAAPAQVIAFERATTDSGIALLEVPPPDEPAPVEAEAEQAQAEPAPVLEAAPQVEPEPAPILEAVEMVEVVEEIVLSAPDEPISEVPPPSLPDDDESLLWVDSLRVGSWFELVEDDEHKVRCKLAAMIKPTGKYIFVNRTGMKVLEKTRMGLAVEYRRQSIRMLDDALLFDRALESVIGNLRRLKDVS
ncbi:MAG: DUF1631 domain-containing protein [Pseudomonas marincola]|uniref:DUF1631 domain-containing protein n=1 Tax=Pseudomonas marincola TaxID=437900 RepID=UPI00300328AE